MDNPTSRGEGERVKMELSKSEQVKLGRELKEEIGETSLDRALSVLIEWGIIEADLASEIMSEEVSA